MEHFNPILGNETTGQKFITCGEIMLRLTPPNYEKIRMASAFEASYGGSEANIALALANLGVDSTFFSVVPNNSLGKSAVRWLRSNDVHCTPMILTEPNRDPLQPAGTTYLSGDRIRHPRFQGHLRPQAQCHYRVRFLAGGSGCFAGRLRLAAPERHYPGHWAPTAAASSSICSRWPRRRA